MRTRETLVKSIDDLQERMDRDVESYGTYSKWDYFAWESFVAELRQYDAALDSLAKRPRRTGGAT